MLFTYVQIQNISASSFHLVADLQQNHKFDKVHLRVPEFPFHSFAPTIELFFLLLTCQFSTIFMSFFRVNKPKNTLESNWSNVLILEKAKLRP